VIPIAVVAIVVVAVIFLVPSLRKKVLPHRDRVHFKPDNSKS